MAYDYTQNKTPIFTDINDQPRSATSTTASNGSDLIAKVNSTLDNLVTDLSALENNNNTGGTPQLTIDVSGFNDLSDWSGNTSNNRFLAVFFIPEFINFFLFTTANGFSQFVTVDLGAFPAVRPNDDFASQNLTNAEILTIKDSDVNGVSSLDITDFVLSRGKGLYLFVPYERAGFDEDFPSSQTSGISFVKNSGNDAIGVRTLQVENRSDRSWGNTSKVFGAIRNDLNATVKELDVFNRLEALEVKSMNFVGDYSLNPIVDTSGGGGS